MICAVLFTQGCGADPDDPDGCLLPAGHEGPHEFVARDRCIYLWETDWACPCCTDGDGDFCSIYWKKGRAVPEQIDWINERKEP